MAKDVKEKQENIAAGLALAEKPQDETVVDEVVEKKEVEKSPEKPKEKEGKIKITYHENAKVTCASCGTVFTVGSTKPEIHVEVCSACHPFFTGQAKFVDTEGRVEAFQRRASAKKEAKEKKVEAPSKPERPKSLKEMLELIQAEQ